MSLTSPYTAAFVANTLGVEVGDDHFTAIQTDTRSILPGALFVALTGERFDGHDFLAAARDAGAHAAVVRRGTAPIPGLRLLEVSDPLEAWGDLARARRRLITGPVIAITGQILDFDMGIRKFGPDEPLDVMSVHRHVCGSFTLQPSS